MAKFKYPNLAGQEQYFDDGAACDNQESFRTCHDESDSQGVQTACDSHPNCENMSHCHQSMLNLGAEE